MKFSEKEYEKFLKIKLKNVLRGEAELILGDRSTSIKDKQIFMRVIEEMEHRIIDNIEVNCALIKEYNERMDDDL